MEKMTKEQLEQWIEALDEREVSSSDTEIEGVRVSVWEDSSLHSEKVSMTISLLDYDISLKRDGRKVISYDQWVDTDWYRWEHE